MENNILNSSATGTRRAEQKPRTLLSGSDFQTQPPERLRTGEYCLKGENGQTFWLTDKQLAMGLLLLGSTRCGKTTTIFHLLEQIIPSMTNQDIMIIFDSKGDFKQKFYNPQNPKHVLVSLSKRDAKFARPWNVFRELEDEDGELTDEFVDIQASEISKALFQGFESESQPFFNIAAADIAAKLMCSFVKEAARTNDTSKLTNLALSDVLSRSDNKEILDITGKNPEYQYLRAYVGDGRSNQALGVYGYLMSMKQRNLIGSFNKADQSRDFGIGELVRNRGGVIVFLEYDVRYAETLGVIYSLLYDLAIKEALSTPGGNKFFICDEASLLPYIQHMGDLLNFGAGFGCKTIVGLQSFAQLKKNYGEDGAAAIAAGFCNMFAYQNTDYASRNYVKQRCGEVFEAYSYAGQNISHDSFTIRDSDLNNLLTGQAFVDLKNLAPFRFQFSE